MTSEKKDLADAPMSERELDRTLDETFPASDPPSWTLGTDHREAERDEAESERESGG